MATEQIAVRLAPSQLAAIDELVASGAYDSRAAVVREGIELVAELDRRRRHDAAVIAGYRRIPPTQGERDAAIASLRAAIEDEPW